MLSIVIFFNFKLHKKKCVEKYKFTERCQLGAPLYVLFKQFFINLFDFLGTREIVLRNETCFQDHFLQLPEKLDIE